MTPEVIAVWSSVLLVIATGALALATYFLYRVTAKSASAAIESVDEIRRAREQEAMPYVILQVEHRRDIPGLSDIKIRNIGRGPAFDIQCTFLPDFPYPSDDSRNMSDLRIFSQLRLLGQGDELSFLLGPTAQILGEESSTPESFDVQISFKDSFGKSYEYTLPVDITETSRVHYVAPTTLHDIDKRLERLERIFDRLHRDLGRWLGRQ
jgi:hypothetical protein